MNISPLLSPSHRASDWDMSEVFPSVTTTTEGRKEPTLMRMCAFAAAFLALYGKAATQFSASEITVESAAVISRLRSLAR